jgi:23S rRNA (guanosine2251-2'-O)-methyltransferase
VTQAVPGRRAAAEALAAGRDVSRLLVQRGAQGLDDLVAAARRAGARVETGDRARLDEAAAGVVHQGVVALAAPPATVSVDAVADRDLVVVLDGITDPHNLGAIARAAEVAGAAAVVLPRRRSAPVTPAAEKAAAGAFSWLAVAPVAGVPRALEALARAGRWSVGLDGAAPTALWDCPPVLGEALALVVGSEGAGLARLVRQRCDVLVAIPTAGHVASLNAAVAAGVALMEIRRVRRALGPSG